MNLLKIHALKLAAFQSTVLFLALFFLQPQVANSEPLDKIASWELEFMHLQEKIGICLATKTSDTTLYVLGVGGQGRIWILDIYPQSIIAIIAGRDYTVQFTFDKSRAYSLEATAVNEKLLRVSQLNPIILQEFADSHELDLSIDGSALAKLSLKGTQKLVRGLINCYKQRIESQMSPSEKREQRLARVRYLNAEVNKLLNKNLFHKAQFFAERAREIADELGGSDPEAAFSYNNLALTYASSGRSEEAVKLYKSALEILEESLGPDHYATGTTLYNMGALLGSLGRHSDAQDLIERAIETRLNVTDEESLGLALMLNDLGVQYQAQGLYDKAIVALSEALDRRRSELGADHPAVAFTLQNIALTYGGMGRYKDAEIFYQEAIATHKKSSGEKHPTVASSLQGLADIYLHKGRNSDAESLYREAFAIVRNQSIPLPKEASYILNGLARISQAKGDYKGAAVLYEDALALKKEVFGPQHPEVAATLNNIAGLYQLQGLVEKALEMSLLSHEIIKEALGQKHPDTALSLNNLAYHHIESGHYAEAEQKLQNVLREISSTVGTSHSTFALALGNLANVYQLQGRFNEAASLYKKSISLKAKSLGDDHPDVLAAINNLAVLYASKEQHQDAVDSLERVLKGWKTRLGPKHPNVASALNNLAESYVSLGRDDEAEDFHKRALFLREETLGPEHPDVALSLNNLAVFYYKKKRYADSAKLHRRAISIRNNILPWNHADIATSVNNLAWVYRDSRKAFGVFFKIELPDLEKPLRRKVLEIHASRLVGGISGEQGGGLTAADRRGHVLPYLELLARNKLEQQADIADVVTAMQLGRRLQNGEEYTLLAQRVATKGDDALSELVRARQDLSRRTRHLQSVVIGNYSTSSDDLDPVALEGLQAEYKSVIKEQLKVSQRLRQEYPSLAELEGRRLADLGTLQNALKAREAVLAWVLGDKESYLLIIPSEGLPTLRVLPVTEIDVSRKVQQLHRALDLGDPDHYGELAAFPAALSADLFGELFGSDWQSDLNGIEQIILVPEGPLSRLAFSALLTETPDQAEFSPNSPNYREAPWLVRRFAVSALPSLSALSILRGDIPAHAPAEPFLGVGDPLLDDHPAKTRGFHASVGAKFLHVRDVRNTAEVQQTHSTAVEMRDIRLDRIRQQPSLPDTAVELRRIAELLGADEESLLLREAATEQRVKETLLNRYGTLSFATHGVLAGELGRGIEPGLILTPPAEATDTDDGFLSLSEVAALDLNADWVLLSACNTAASSANPSKESSAENFAHNGGGEGLTGLAKAFTYAGAKALLVSQWSVASGPTVELMESLFRNYRDREHTRAEAHRQAMLGMLDADDPLYSHPSIWAPFVVVGDGG